MMYGVRIKQHKDDHIGEYWFNTQEERERFIIKFSKQHFNVIDYMSSNQLELNLDTR